MIVNLLLLLGLVLIWYIVVMIRTELKEQRKFIEVKLDELREEILTDISSLNHKIR